MLIARDNDTRRALNERARGLVGLGQERSYGTAQVAVGDRVICRRNDRLVDVDNGTRGTVRAVDDAGVVIETDGGTFRRLPATYVAHHVEHAYALTGHGMQGATVERAFVVACPHELTKGWSYTALSRAREQTRLFVITDTQERQRDELAPGERQAEPTETEVYTRVARYMQTRDDEDLAIEQLLYPNLAPGRAADTELDQAAVVHELEEAAAERSEPAVPAPASIAAFRIAADRVAALQAQLDALGTPEVKRLEAAESREQELIAHQDELLEQARQIPPRPKLPFASDRHAHERENLQRALEGADAELHGVRALRGRLVREVGEPDQIRAERGALEIAMARALTDRDTLRSELVAQELASSPRWAIGALGERPSARRERERWDRAARGLARYRLEHAVVDHSSALGERPTDPARAERYEQARTTLERVRHEFGVHAREREPVAPPGLPSDYARLFGEQRAALLEQALAAEHEHARALTDEQLHALARADGGAIAEPDRQAGRHAVRLEREHAHHQQTARKQTDRAAELDAQVSELGWRARHEREQLRHDAALQRRHAARHAADAERIELEPQRLHAAGRHPDQWLKEHGQQLVAQLAAAKELAHRRELQIDQHAELAITHPPQHVCEVIGPRPVSGVRLAQQWGRLAEQIERQRLTYGLDVDRDGPLGPDPSQIARDQRGTYAEQRHKLAEAVERYREARKLPAHEQTREITRDRERDQTLDREF